MKTTIAFTTALWAICFFTNCKNASRARQIQTDIVRSTTEEQYLARRTGDSIRIQYIGCGGFLMRYGHESVLLDPYFSNATFGQLLHPLHSDTTLIDNFFVQNLQNRRDTEGVIQTVLIAHAHHDHLADLPSLLKRNLFLEKITLIGSQTMSHIIQSYHLPIDAHRQIISFDSIFEQKNRSSPREIEIQAQYMSQSGRLKITVVKTEHAPHFCGKKIPCIGGDVKKIPKKTPKKTFGFKEGVNYNFMIDFLNADGSIVFRIFSNAGASANAPIGFPAPSVLNQKKVDVLLLCGANYDQVKSYPEKLVALIKPEKIFVAHWENFFKPIPKLLKKPQTVPMTNIPQFLKILKNTMSENGIEPKPIIVQPLTPVTIKF